MSISEREPEKPGASVWSNERIAYVVELLVHQDTLTWTITSVSLAGQTILLGFYFQPGTSGRYVVALMGLVSSLIMMVFTLRSDTYMNHYIRLLRVTGRVEFLPLPYESLRTERRREKWRESPEGFRRKVRSDMLRMRSINSAGT